MDDHAPRFSDPLFNGGQQMRIHEGDAAHLVVDDGEERRFQVDAGDGHALTAGPPPGTIGAALGRGATGGGPQTNIETDDAADELSERFGDSSDSFGGSQFGWTEEAGEPGSDPPGDATGERGTGA